MIMRLLAMLLIGFVCGVLGLIVGALIGGNYATQFVFNGVQGYEATGQVGFLLGALIGLVSSAGFLQKRKSSSSR